MAANGTDAKSAKHVGKHPMQTIYLKAFDETNNEVVLTETRNRPVTETNGGLIKYNGNPRVYAPNGEQLASNGSEFFSPLGRRYRLAH